MMVMACNEFENGRVSNFLFLHYVTQHLISGNEILEIYLLAFLISISLKLKKCLRHFIT